MTVARVPRGDGGGRSGGLAPVAGGAVNPGDFTGEVAPESRPEITLGERRALQRRYRLHRWLLDGDWPAFFVLVAAGGWFLWIYLEIAR